MSGNMSHPCHARDASHVHLQKFGRDLRADRPFRRLKRLPRFLHRGIDWGRHFPSRAQPVNLAALRDFYKPIPKFRQTDAIGSHRGPYFSARHRPLLRMRGMSLSVAGDQVVLKRIGLP